MAGKLRADIRGARRSRPGFTLIEVLVALVVLGAIASAAIALIGQNTRFVSSAEDRLLASIVADNAMVETLSLPLLERGESDAEAELGGERWTYVRTVADPGVEGLLRVDIAVRRAASAQTLARVTTLRPANGAVESVAPQASGN